MKRQQLLRTNAEEKMPWLSKGQGHDSGIRKRNDRDRLSVSLSFSVTICLSYSVSLFLSSSLSLCLSIWPPISSTTGSSPLAFAAPLSVHPSSWTNDHTCICYHKLWVHPQACFLYCCFRDGSHFFCTFDVKNRVRAVKKHHHQNLILYRFNCVSGKLLTKREICQQVMDCHVKSLIIINHYWATMLINKYV